MGLITTVYEGSSVDRTIQWLCPAGTTLIQVAYGIGSGGRGGSAQGIGARGGGGAGGSFARKENIPVTPGQLYDIFVPGTTVSPTTGKDATLSKDGNVLMRAKGGAGGGDALGGNLSGAAGLGSTVDNIGDNLFRGGNGSAGVGNTRTGAGGGGAGTNGAGGDAVGITRGLGTPERGGPGGSGSTSSVGSVGVNGSIYGGGGSGGRANDGTLRTGGVGAAGIVILIYDVPNGTDADVIACDEFTGPNAPDIEGRILDGCGGLPQGTWDWDSGYNNVGDSISIIDGTAGFPDEAEVQYLIKDKACPNVDFQGARAYLRFPNYDTVSVPEFCELLWQDDFTSGIGGSLDGRTHNGGSAGTGTYVRNNGAGSGDHTTGIQIDTEGRLFIPGSGVDGKTLAVYRIDGLTLPTDYDVVIDVERTFFVGGSGSSTGNVGIHTRMPDGVAGNQVGYWMSYATSLEDGGADLHGHWNGYPGSGSVIGTIITGSAQDPPGDHGINKGETRSIRFRVRNTNPAVMETFISDEDEDDCIGGRPGGSLFDGMFGSPRANFVGGDPGVRMTSGGSGLDEGSYRIKAIRIYKRHPGISGFVSTWAYAWILLQASEDPPFGYQVAFEGVRFSAQEGFQLATFIYEYRLNPFFSFTLLRDWTPVGNNIPIDQSLTYICEAVIEVDPVTAHPCIIVRVNGVVVQRFDLIADTPEGSNNPLPPAGLHSGVVGLGGYDSTFEFTGNRSLIIERYELLCRPDEGGDEECTGYRIFVQKNKKWRLITSDELKVYKNLSARAVRQAPEIPLKVLKNMKWRTPKCIDPP